MDMRYGVALVLPCCFASSTGVVIASSKKSRSKKKKNHNYPEQAPPRITSNVKQNLQALRLWREFERQKSSTPRPATSYRRKKVVKKELPEDIELHQEPTTKLNDSNQVLSTAVPVLLVDGYNVCGYWQKLKEDFMEGRLEIARQELIDELRALSVANDVKVVVVFDAELSGLPTRKESYGGIDVVFSSNTSADFWIEREVEALKEDGCEVLVATNDVYEQQSVLASGAIVWSCQTLVSEINDSKMEIEERITAFEERENGQRSTSLQGKLLRHNLAPEVVNALKDLKQKLLENESR